MDSSWTALSSTAHTPKDRLSLAGAGVWGACCIVVARPNGPDATVATRSLADAPPVPPLLHDLAHSGKRPLKNEGEKANVPVTLGNVQVPWTPPLPTPDTRIRIKISACFMAPHHHSKQGGYVQFRACIMTERHVTTACGTH
mmetsp:Transcript_55983/g.92988  ORF Transcript_55983/g.92988 Transcript_55983/m.92988 type:complete len:142 (+) Transcript_55983:484-909(+)